MGDMLYLMVLESLFVIGLRTEIQDMGICWEPTWKFKDPINHIFASGCRELKAVTVVPSVYLSGLTYLFINEPLPGSPTWGHEPLA